MTRRIPAVCVVLALLGVAPTTAAAEDVSLYDNDGEAVAYIAVDDDLTIYLWEGTPVAYLDSENVYGFNGQHLGWFSEGVILDHTGDAPCVLKDRYPGSTAFEGFKGFKEFKPFKSFKEYAPYKPYASNQLSSTPCSIFLAAGGQ